MTEKKMTAADLGLHARPTADPEGRTITNFAPQSMLPVDAERAKTDDIVGHTILILSVPGTMTGRSLKNPAEESEAYQVLFEYDDNGESDDPQLYGWLCNTDSVIGRQLKAYIDKLPLRARVAEMKSKSGMNYYCLEAPNATYEK